MNVPIYLVDLDIFRYNAAALTLFISILKHLFMLIFQYDKTLKTCHKCDVKCNLQYAYTKELVTS